MSNHILLQPAFSNHDRIHSLRQPNIQGRSDVRRNLLRHLGPNKSRISPFALNDMGFDASNGVEALRKLSENELLTNTASY